MPIRIGGSIFDREYYESTLKPLFEQEGVTWLGHLDHSGKIELLQGARALLTPVEIDEAFGMTTLEALATGIPVISFDRGGARDLIQPGRNGFLVRDVDEMCESVARLASLDTPRGIRDDAEQRFSMRRMCDGYTRAYASIAGQLSAV